LAASFNFHRRAGPASILNFPTFGCFAENIPGGNSNGQRRTDSAEQCRDQLAECRRLMPLAKSPAEATVLKNLVRSWKMIANQMALYEAILKDQK
jgi:hypothetical protein